VHGVELRRLFFNYLRISPTYRLASQSSDGSLRRGTSEHSKAAIRCYRRFGDVWNCDFSRWRGPELIPSGNPTRRVEALPPDTPYTPRADNRMTVVLVPNELSTEAKLQQFRALVAATAQTPQLAVRPKTLWKCLAAVYAKACNPSAELWRIGLIAGSVERYQGLLDPWAERKLAKDALERRHLTLSVIRLLKNALAVAENAAVGTFPNPDPQPWQQLAFAFTDNQLDDLLRQSAGDEHPVVRERLALPPLIEH